MAVSPMMGVPAGVTGLRPAQMRALDAVEMLGELRKMCNSHFR